MASFTAQADAIRSAITSVSTCTPTISATLKELLQGRQVNNDESSKTSLKPIARKTTQLAIRTKPSTTTRTTKTTITKKPTQNTPAAAPTTADACQDTNDLTPREKAVLATQVVNATLKALGEAAKTPPPVSNTVRSPVKNNAFKTNVRTRLRRSTSVPLTPLRQRTLNRVSTSPATTKAKLPLPTPASTGCLALVECARVAFATLRSLQTSGAIILPDLQLETGMSSLIAKLITLKMFDPAVKELRILKRRLEGMASGNGNKKSSAPTNTVNAPPKTLSDLLDYPAGVYSGSVLSFVITSQLQALRIIYEQKKTIILDAIIPFLRPTNPTSPLNLLLSSVHGEKPECVKVARQLENLAQTLLALTPSLSSKEDDVAQEPRLSPSPETALESQALGMITRLESWNVSGHKGDIDKDILLPLSRCLAAFARRTSRGQSPKLTAAFEQVWGKMEAMGFKAPESAKASLASIYQLLANAYQESGNTKEAKKWTISMNGLTNPDVDSAAKCCAVAAQLLALSLKEPAEVDENLIMQVLDGMQGTLGGNVVELDDLLVNLCLLRKVAFHIVIKKPYPTTAELKKRHQLLEAFIDQLPRFAVRWLGKPPPSNSTTKDHLRFEQRRQLLTKYQRPILDSVLLLTKTRLDEERLAWETMDPMLQDTLVLLDYMGDFGQSSTEGDPATSYHVKISHLYYQYYISLRKSDAKNVDSTMLRSVKRSIDCVKQQSEPIQSKSQLVKKWEAFVELCRLSGRKDDAMDALRSIRDHLVRRDTVQAITTSLASQPVRQSWSITADAVLLSRAVSNLAKLERKPIDWTWLLTGEDKATALEHDLHFILINHNHTFDMSDPIIVNLLQFYSPEKYPIRRLRSLLVLLAASIDSRAQVETLRTDSEAVMAILEAGSLGNDSGLARYIPYLRHSVRCTLGIACGEVDSPDIQQAISSWKSMVAGCHSASQLAEHVEDSQQLLKTVQSLADLARMKGLQTLLTDVVELSTMITQLTVDDDVESHILQSTNLCLHYLSLGQSINAEQTLQAIMDRVTLPQVSSDIVSNFHLSASEYYLTVGNFDKAEKHLIEAREAVISPTNQICRNSAVNRKISTAYASFLTSSLSLEKGENHRALKLAKTAVKILFHDWSQLEQYRIPSTDVSVADISQAESADGDASLNHSRMSDCDMTRASTGPEFWALVYPLYRFTYRLSSIYAHLGMYQETVYYAEQTQKIAESMDSSYHLAQATTWLASVTLMAGDLAKSVELVNQIKPALLASEPSCQTITAMCQAASVYREAEGIDAGSELLMRAELKLQDLQKSLVKEVSSAADNVVAGAAKNPVKEKPSSIATSRATTRVTRTAKPTIAPASKKTVAKRSAVKEPIAPVKAAVEVKEEDIQLKSLQASVLHSRSLTFLKKKDWESAITALRNAAQLSRLSSDLSQEHFVLGMSLIGQSLKQMGTDSVFSFIQDSTLSFPSVATAARDKVSHGQAVAKKTSPVRKPRSTAQEKKNFVDNLHEAQDHLLEAHAIATRNGNGVFVHRISAALQNVSVLLANTSSSGAGTSHPAHATCSIELARNLTWRRERKANRCDAMKDSKPVWPMVIDSADPRRSSLGFSIDMNRFQREYIDIIPNNWNVVSVSLSEDRHDLCITKLQAGFSPFALRLPLERAVSRDADTEVFDFQQGQSELLDLIKRANQTCHDARDMSQKGAKTAWWAEREELDDMLKSLLDTIEETWLGGFKGIFSQHHQRSDLLAKFQKSFQIILEKYLPSRRNVRGRRAKSNTVKVNLDPRILELFIGLGDASASDNNMDEPLTDLLYFVVDVLQFHGETNAYDEIDFDEMVVDTFDALHAYHSLAKENQSQPDDAHTILILDKSLHVFPWESLPCLQGLAVSRVPSLDCLRRAIVESSSRATDSADSEPSRAGHHVSVTSGSYILNPSADLTTTQATFGKALSTLPATWESIETRAPTEAEFETALRDKDVLLYFGHGSGAQYIRGRTVRQLEKCRAVALLMGCSSASLAHVGDFEPYGPVWNYMLAGAPAVVGTLWDVTDRDIDRFAGSVFEEWGLLPRGSFVESGSGSGSGSARKIAARKKKKVAAKKVEVEGKEKGRASLVEAVARARVDACRFRYLTAAAVVVYGIPVYVFG